MWFSYVVVVTKDPRDIQRPITLVVVIHVTFSGQSHFVVVILASLVVL